MVHSLQQCFWWGCRGPRDEIEIFSLLAHGIKQENIKALDLITYSELVQAADMHEIPFPDNEFDVVIGGWVYTYSKEIKSALKESVRVLRPGGLLAIGWDASFTTLENRGTGHLDKREHIKIVNVKDICELLE